MTEPSAQVIETEKAVASSGRPSNDRDGECICNYGPNTEGPDECCPFHGRPYAYWIERGDTLQQRLDATPPQPSDALETRLRELHAPMPHTNSRGVYQCQCCSFDHPCPTLRLLLPDALLGAAQGEGK